MSVIPESPLKPRRSLLFLGSALAAAIVLGGILYVTVTELRALEIEASADGVARLYLVAPMGIE